MILDNTYFRLNVRISNYLCFNHFVLIPLALPPPTIAVSSAPLTIAGGSVSLTCTATVIDHLVVTPDLQWLAPDGSDLVTMGDIVQFGLVFTREVRWCITPCILRKVVSTDVRPLSLSLMVP